MYPADGATYEELLVNADLAMYAAKSSGRNTYAFFTAELAEIALARHALENVIGDRRRDEGAVPGGRDALDADGHAARRGDFRRHLRPRQDAACDYFAARHRNAHSNG